MKTKGCGERAEARVNPEGLEWEAFLNTNPHSSSSISTAPPPPPSGTPIFRRLTRGVAQLPFFPTSVSVSTNEGNEFQARSPPVAERLKKRPCGALMSRAGAPGAKRWGVYISWHEGDLEGARAGFPSSSGPRTHIAASSPEGGRFLAAFSLPSTPDSGTNTCQPRFPLHPQAMPMHE